MAADESVKLCLVAHILRGTVQNPEALSLTQAVFESFGRAAIFLDPDFRVIQASPTLWELIGTEASRNQRIDELLGAELFGPTGMLRNALRNGEKREGWRAEVGGRQVAISVAPLVHSFEGFESEVAYVVLVGAADTADAQVPEREMVRAALDANRWKREETAHALGISRTTLWRKMRELGLLNRALREPE